MKTAYDFLLVCPIKLSRVLLHCSAYLPIRPQTQKPTHDMKQEIILGRHAVISLSGVSLTALSVFGVVCTQLAGLSTYNVRIDKDL